ncbi:MAG: maleylpyruvate isomerase family mycothiol-dependent enzyme [Acidimicrobiales bacterium]
MEDTGTARPALAAAAERSSDMIRSVPDMDVAIPGSEWTVGDAASHLIFALRAFTDSANSKYPAWRQVEDRLAGTTATAKRIAAINRVLIPQEPARSPAEAAAAIQHGAAAFLEATAGAPSSQRLLTPWYGDGESLGMGEATCLLLGEQVMHGFDIAKALGRSWHIPKSDAHLILQAARAMIPKMADPEAIGRTTATYRLHLGGTSGFVVRCADGALQVQAPGSQRVDCHVAADPVTFLLLGYGRISLWQAIGRAKMATWGRKPWLALRFTSFVTRP